MLLGSQGLVRAGKTSNASYNHYSIGRTIEAALGLGALTANDQYGQPINDAFVATSGTGAASLSTTMPSISKGQFIAFAFDTPFAQVSAKNWIGIYPQGGSPGHGSSTSWQYTPAASGTATFDTSGLAPGNYTAWYCNNDGYTVIAGPVSFTVH